MDEEVDAVVIDSGSDTLKCGWAGSDRPRFVFPNAIGKPKGSVDLDSKEVFIGDRIIDNKDLLLKHPIKNGIITSFDDMEKIWNYTFYNVLRIQPEEHPILFIG